MRFAQLAIGLVIVALLAAILTLLLIRAPVAAPREIPTVEGLCPSGTAMAVWYFEGERRDGCVQTDINVLPTATP